MTDTGQRTEAFEDVRAAVDGAELAAAAAVAERNVLDSDIDAGSLEPGSAAHLARLEAVDALEAEAAAAAAAADRAVERLLGLEAAALTGRSDADLGAAVRSAERRRESATTEIEQLAWTVEAEAARRVQAGEGWSEPGEAAPAPAPDAMSDAGPITATVIPPPPGPRPAPVAGGRSRLARSARRRVSALRPTASELLTSLAAVAVVVALLVALGGRNRGTALPVSVAAPVQAPTTPPRAPATTAPAPTAPVSGAPPVTFPTTAAPAGSTMTALAAACPSLRSGTLGSLKPSTAGAGFGADPRTKAPSPYVGVGFPAGSDVQHGTAYAIVAILIQPGGTSAHTGPAIDRQGEDQLWFTSDGAGVHAKGIRRLVNGTWSMTVGTGDLTVAFGPTSVYLYWAGIQSGWTYAMYVATPSGCDTVASGPGGTPAPVVTS